MFCRPRGLSPYDATFGPGLSGYSPVVARTTLHARQILGGRPSYLKAFLVYSRGALNATFCDNCAPVLDGAKEFTAFAGCVSIHGEWGGACSNCIWQDHGARCTAGGGDGSSVRTPAKRRLLGTKRDRSASGGSAGSPLLIE
ncbi:hypothetical protein ACJBU6_07429 [Exserohilum turcicum]